MPELYLQRNEGTLIVKLGEQSATVPLERILPPPTLWQQIYEDAATYGRDLFEHTFGDGTLKTLLAELPARGRLLLIADDPQIAQIPWEYLRDQNNKLLASRLTVVRSVSGLQQTAAYAPAGPLEILAIPAAPIDESVHLNVEQEWRHLVKVVTNLSPARALTLKRLRPPTCNTLAGTLSRQGTSIVHFIGHGLLYNGKACLVFEDARGRQQFVDATDLADALNEQVFLVILNSCLSATVASTEFGNIATALVRRGIPYALGMQCILPDEAAQVLSQELLRFLLQGYTLEEAMMHTRRALQELGQSSHPDWLAGLPVLYTSQRERPTAPLTLASGQAIILPDPRHLDEFVDLTALPPAEHFLGRVGPLSNLLDLLLSPSAHGFVMLHGLGGIGKTSLARVAAERMSWYYADRVLAASFETFATLNASNQRVVNEAFVDRFYARLAELYRLDPAKYNTLVELQQAILRERTHQRSLLILDNIETLLDTLSHPVAQGCAAFLVRLKEGEGVILLTSRMLAPADWGIETNKIITLAGLPPESGADLFLAYLPANRRPLAPHATCLALSQRVQGHPLSIRLLAGRFADETALDLATFLHTINAELVAAERATPGSLEDPERQKTLYACIDYSARRLTPEQRTVFDTVSLFQAPFIEEFANTVLDNPEQISLHLQHLVRLGLLNCITRTFAEGELILFELHPMVRWYIELSHPDLAADVKERYGEMYADLVRDAAQPASDYERSALVRTLVRQSFVDCEAAGAYLTPAASSTLAYNLANLYHQMGQIRRTLDLYEQSLQTYQDLGDVRDVATTQKAMADVYVRQGKVEEALKLYAQSLQTTQDLGDVRSVAVMQKAMADVYVRQGKVEEALRLYAQSLQTAQDLGDVQGIAITQHAMANVYMRQGKMEEALGLYEQSLQTLKDLGDVREMAVTQQAMANVYVQQGKVEEALRLYAQSLQTYQELGDVRGVAVTQHAMADVYVRQGKVEEALGLYEQSLQMYQDLGDIGGMAATQANLGQLLMHLGKHEQALSLTWNAYKSLTALHFAPDAQGVQGILTYFKTNVLKEELFDQLWQQAIGETQPEWLLNARLDAKDAVSLSDEEQEALSAYLTAADWNETRQVLETQQALLFQPAVEQVLEQLLEYAQNEKNQGKIKLFKLHLALLRQCKSAGIASAFAHLEKEAPKVEATAETVPFPPELVNQSVTAMRGNTQEKEAYRQSLAEQLAQTTDEQLKALLSTIQDALFSTDLSAFGGDLVGVYKQAWNVIASTVVAEGMDPRLFEAIVNNTVAVLGPESEHRSEWRNSLADLRNQTTMQENRSMVAFVDTIVALLDADGKPEGLGTGLQGIYAQTWQTIVALLLALSNEGE